MKHFSTILVFVFILTLSISFAQTKWEKYGGNPILQGGSIGSWDYHVYMPFVIKDGDIWKMWFTGEGKGLSQTGYATSEDGIAWDRHVGNPVVDVGSAGSWDDRGLYNPQVIFDGETYHMWYGGWDGTENPYLGIGNARLGYATSPDGITWTKHGDNPVMDLCDDCWYSDGLSGVSVLFKDTLYHCWFGGIRGNSAKIGYARSINGIEWEVDSLNNPVLEPGASGGWDSKYVYIPHVIYNEDMDRFEMWYAGSTDNVVRRIGFAFSQDGVSWTKYEKNPVLSPGAGSDWDRGRFSGAYVMRMAEKYGMWYASGTEKLQIGYATAPFEPTGINDQINYFPGDFVLRQNYPNPFNPVTMINYQLPARSAGGPMASDVELSIYNLLGQKVATLVNKKQAAGSYQVQWDASSFASGVYYYKIKAGDYHEVKKMILIK